MAIDTKVPTVRVVNSDVDAGYVLINESDFTDGVHTLHESDPAYVPDKPKGGKLKAVPTEPSA